MAADINNTASQGASFIGEGSSGREVGWARGGKRMGWVSGENKPFAALIESLSLAAARSCQGECLFTTQPLWESVFYQLFNVSKVGG